MSISTQSAESIALRAVAWLVGEDELLPVFLGATGANEADLRASISDPAFLGAVMDFLLMDDAWVIACTAAQGIPPETLATARAALPGGAQTHWT